MARTAIDPRNRMPLYRQLAEILRDLIDRGEIPPDHPIPSKRALSETYGVSLRTVDSAITLLKAERYLEPEIGRGMFVLGPEAREQKPPHPRRRSTDRPI